MKTSTKAKIVLVAGLSIIGTFVGFLNFGMKTESNKSASEIFFGIESVLAQEQGQIEYKNTIRDQLNKNDYSGAVVTCDRAVRDYPNDADFWYFKGLALAETKQFDKAMEAYKKAISIHVDKNRFVEHKNKTALEIYEKGLANSEKYPDLAINQLLESQNLEPDNPSGFLNAGAVYLFNKGVFENAIKYANEALKIKSDYVEGYVLLGNSYYQSKQWKEALFYFKVSAMIEPNDSWLLNKIDECSKHLNNRD